MLKRLSESHHEVTTICSDFKERAWWESRVQTHSDARNFCQQTGEAEKELGDAVSVAATSPMSSVIRAFASVVVKCA